MSERGIEVIEELEPDEQGQPRRKVRITDEHGHTFDGVVIVGPLELTEEQARRMGQRLTAAAQRDARLRRSESDRTVRP